MNAAGAHGQHQKDAFLNAFFQGDPSPADLDPSRAGGRPSDMFAAMPNNPGSHPAMMSLQQQQQSLQNSQVSMDVLESFMAMQQASQNATAGQNGQPSTPQMLLEQQMRLNQLQQLQQLQNQIFQQQIELLSGNSNNNFPGGPGGMEQRARESQNYGLPTPTSSTELHAQHSTDFVSPMLLHPNNNAMGNHPQMSQVQAPQFIPQHLIPPTPHSAPANIAFGSGTSFSVSGQSDLDFNEISPLTSPWLGAYNNNGQPVSPPDGQSLQSSISHGTKKRRTSTPSGDEMSNANRPQRKRQSTTNRPPATSAPNKKSNLRVTRSANSTPLFPPTNASPVRMSPAHRVAGLSNDIPGDTPSPVDLSMPPPAPPIEQLAQFTQGSSTNPTPPNTTGQNTPNTAPISNTPAEPLMPVTPASIMNLGRLGTNSSLAPLSTTQMPTSGAIPDKPARSKAGGRTRASTVNNNAKAGSSNQMPVPSPSLKPIRPAGGASASKSPVTPVQPILQVRKTSHKAAEQKRRDSLKTSFDELRILLPPIPLPSDEGYPDEPVLPGAMPPRGPPKGNADGPNRGVSKLQLLRCGNEFIRILKGRVQRRDDEIDRLRQEISRMRIATGGQVDGDDLDMVRDLDDVENTVGGLFGRTIGNIPEEDEEQGDGGE